MYLGAHLVVILTLIHHAQGAEYLLAAHRKSNQKNLYISSSTDGRGGVVEIQYPNYGVSYETKLRYNATDNHGVAEKFQLLGGLEFKAILVKTTNEATKITVQGDSFKYNVFSPLPTSALGTKYIISSCRQSRYSSLLVIAAHHKKTTVNIIFKLPSSFSNDGRTFKNGDKHQLQMGPYQTYTLIAGPDLTGTIITSTHPVAVFSGMMNSTFVTAYEQLLPVRLYGREFVVAVDRNDSSYHLQIISEHNDSKLTFNNGSSVTSSKSYRGHFLTEGIFSFNSSYPIMATVCRLNKSNSGLVVVPPVSLYPTETMIKRFPVPSVVLTMKNVVLNITDISWRNIYGSKYKVGVLSSTVSQSVRFHGSVIAYLKHTLFSNGISHGMQQHQHIDSAKSYIVALPRTFSYIHCYLTVSGETDAIYQVIYPHQERRDTRTKSAFSSDYYYIRNDVFVEGGVENKTVLVNFNTDHIHMSFSMDGYRDKEWSFSVLPTFALGRKYIVQSCYNNSVKDFQLIVSSLNTETIIEVAVSQNVSINGFVYNAGDTITVSLKEYQTLTLNSNAPLCGTEVLATQNVAVFTFIGFYDLFLYIQLLPIKDWGQRYIAAVSDQFVFEPWIYQIYKLRHEYFLLITSGQNNTQVTFKDKEHVTVGRGDSYRKAMRKNESVSFSSNQPVMSSVCVNVSSFHRYERRQFTQSACTILVPVDLYANYSIFVLTRQANIRILSDSRDSDVVVTLSQGRSWRQTIDVSWELYTEYKVGSAMVVRGTVYVTSSHRFTVLAYSQLNSRHVHRPGSSYWDPVGTIWNAGIFGPPRYIGSNHRPSNVTKLLPDNSIKSKQETAPVNTTAIVIGTTFGVAIIIKLGIIILQQIHIRRMSKRTSSRFVSSAGNGMNQAADNVSRNDREGNYCAFQTDNQQINLYESMQSSNTAGSDTYENL